MNRNKLNGDKKMFDLTEKEIALVRTFNDAFNYDCAEDEINDNATAIDLKDFVRSTGMPELTVRGVIGSLCTKGLLAADCFDVAGILHITTEGILAHYDIAA